MAECVCCCSVCMIAMYVRIEDLILFCRICKLPINCTRDCSIVKSEYCDKYGREYT